MKLQNKLLLLFTLFQTQYAFGSQAPLAIPTKEEITQAVTATKELFTKLNDITKKTDALYLAEKDTTERERLVKGCEAYCASLLYEFSKLNLPEVPEDEEGINELEKELRKAVNQNRNTTDSLKERYNKAHQELADFNKVHGFPNPNTGNPEPIKQPESIENQNKVPAKQQKNYLLQTITTYPKTFITSSCLIFITLYSSFKYQQYKKKSQPGKKTMNFVSYLRATLKNKKFL